LLHSIAKDQTMTKTLNIDPELQAWLEPLSPTELAGLEASLLADGCRDPLVVWDGWLLDGHNRYALCMKHGLPFTTVEKTGLTTKDDVKIWMVENQSGKRNLSVFARVAYALKIKPLLEARGKARMLAGQADPRQNSDEGPVRTDESIAKIAGVSRDTVRKVEKIIEKASAEIIAQVRTGELSINAAAEMVAPPKPAATEVPSLVATDDEVVLDEVSLHAIRIDTFDDIEFPSTLPMSENEMLESSWHGIALASLVPGVTGALLVSTYPNAKSPGFLHYQVAWALDDTKTCSKRPFSPAMAIFDIDKMLKPYGLTVADLRWKKGDDLAPDAD
jgi:ParB-like chromosome segregation protein Spo0J